MKLYKKIILILFSLLIFGCSIFKSKPNHNNEEKYKYLTNEVYINDEYDYTTLVPKNWTSGMIFNNKGSVRFDDMYNNSYILISVISSKFVKPDKITDTCKTELNETNYEFEFDMITINKTKYEHIIFKNNLISQSIFITEVNDKTYLISCFTPPGELDLYDDVFLEFINSITYPTSVEEEYKDNLS